MGPSNFTSPENNGLNPDNSFRPDIHIPGGQIPITSKFYIERYVGYGSGRRTIESKCYQAMEDPHTLISISSPKEMGKTSLMARIIDYISKKGYKTIKYDFSEKELGSDLKMFLQMFCEDLGSNLGVDNKVDAFWQSRDNKVNCTNYFEKHILQISTPITLVLDNIDLVFDLPFALQFLSLLRAWHENGKNSPTWEKLKMIIIYSTQCHLNIPNHQSPFNVGLRLKLQYFEVEQVQALAKCYKDHNLDLTSDDINKLIGIVNGHPFLISKAFYELAGKFHKKGKVVNS